MPVTRTSTITVHLPPLHVGQKEVFGDPARFRVLACGRRRRWGKTRLGASVCIATAATGGRAWWVAPSYPMATVGWRLVKRLAVQIPGAEIRHVDRLITLPGGGEVQVRSADKPDSLRGEGLNFVVLDECAFMAEEAWSEALRPALADRQGGAMFISTPKGRNWFWRLWQRCNDPTQPDWHGWQLPTAANPFINPAEIEAARQSMPELIFEQEFLAQFVDDAGGVFRRVMDAAVGQTIEAGPVGIRRWIVGVDWGQSNDFTVIIVIDPDQRAVVAIDRFNQIDYQVQIDRLSAMLTRFPPLTIIAERNSMGQPLVESLARQGLPVQPFTTTAASKAAAIQALQLAFERGEITIPPDPVLVGELQAYEAKRLPSGLFRYEAPAGMHDDTVMALALAWHGVSTAGSPLVIQPVKRSAWGEQPVSGRWKM